MSWKVIAVLALTLLPSRVFAQTQTTVRSTWLGQETSSEGTAAFQIQLLEIPSDPLGTRKVQISGDIPADAGTRFSRFLKGLQISQRRSDEPRLYAVPLWVYFDSPGGNVSGAMALGRALRSRQAITQVEKEALCASACALAFMGGVSRFPAGGTIGIHRPYPSDGLKGDPVATTRTFERTIKQYIRDMNFPDIVFDEMKVVSPHEIRWLGFGDLERLGFGGSDAAFALLEDSATAASYYISLQEYYRRLARINAECFSPGKDSRACYDKIMMENFPHEKLMHDLIEEGVREKLGSKK